MQNNTRTWKSLLEEVPEAVGKRYLENLARGAGTAASPEELEAFFVRSTRSEANHPVVYVGCGTCGLAAGANTLIEALEEYRNEQNIPLEVVETGCIGYCAVEPIIDLKLPGRQRLSFQQVTAKQIPALLDAVREGKAEGAEILGQFPQPDQTAWAGVPSIDENPFFALQTRQVLRHCGILDPSSLAEYLAHGGYSAYLGLIHTRTNREICTLIKESGLAGRGGGGFSTGTKWEIAAKQNSPVKYMICNADEGDPGAFMDRALIEGDPHRLLEGLAIAAYAIGAEHAYIYIRAEYPLAIRRLKEAITQARTYGLLGSNILDSGVSLDIQIKEGAGAFVCGEETALIHSIEGKRGMPRPRPPYPAVQGLFNKPTVINNVETLANVPEIISRGSGWFAAQGTKSSKGTKVFALSGNVVRTGLIEVEMGTTIRRIIFDIGGGIPGGKAFKAVQIGGPSGGCLTTEHLDLEVDYGSLKGVGAMMGSGGLVVMDENTCMVDVAKYFMEFIRAESCGKCIPCREGTKRIWQILDSITRHRRNEVEQDALERFRGILQLESLAEVIREASLCGLGKSAANPVLSTLRWFRQEYEVHIFERQCPTRTCTAMLSYSIDRDKCKGCTLCQKQCPAGAIVGEKKLPHYILQEKCTGCGNCYTVCRFGAVVTA